MALDTIDTQASVKTAKTTYLYLVGGKNYVYSFEEVDKKTYDAQVLKKQDLSVSYIIQKRVDKNTKQKVDKFYKRTLERVDKYDAHIDDINALVELVDSKILDYQVEAKDDDDAQEEVNSKVQNIIDCAISKAQAIIKYDTTHLLNTQDVKRVAIEVIARSTQQTTYSKMLEAIDNFKFYKNNELLKHVSTRTKKEHFKVDISKFSIHW